MNYLLPRPTSQRIRATTTTISIMADQNPALKMPPTTSHELRVIAVANKPSHKIEYCFMRSSFGE